MSFPNTVSQNSVITSIFTSQTSTGLKFLTCGGTNIAPKSGTWNNFTANNTSPTVGTTNFKYIFNVGKFNGTTNPPITGYPFTGTAPTTIKQSLYNKGTIQYICGQFTSFSAASAQNVVWFNPVVSVTADATFNNLSGITFTGSNNAVNCMSSNLDATFNKIYLAGRFDTANISGATTYKNMVRLNVAASTYTIDSGFTTTGTLLDSSTVTINSMIVVNRILYVAGTDSTSGNCIFYSYNGTTWTNLLLSVSPITGNINVLQAISTTIIAIGGKFTSIGSATNCNNVVLFTISSKTFTVLGNGATKGVTSVAGSSPIYAAPEVFALAFVTKLLWVGGYFVNAGDSPANSIAIYNVSGNSWSTVTRGGSVSIGLLKDTGGTDPGVVYALYASANDTSIIMAGGSFITSTSIVSPSKTSENIFNLVKITTATISSTATTRTYSKFNSISTTPALKS
jgi:hypothetical protein